MAYKGNYTEIPDWYPEEGQTMEPGNDELKEWQVGYKPPAQWRNWQDKGWFLALKAIDQALADHEAKKENTHNVGEGHYVAKTANPEQYPRKEEIVNFAHNNAYHTEDFATEAEVDAHEAKTSGVHGVGNSEVASKDWVNGKLTAQNIGIAVISGTIRHGETLPLPAGYTENQCHWIVSIHSMDNGGQYDDRSYDGIRCYVDENRIVRVGHNRRKDNPSGGWFKETANYLVIGMK